MFTCKVKSEDKPLVFWSFRNRTIQSHNDRCELRDTIDPRDTYSSSSSFLFIIPIHLIEIFYSIEVCGWVSSWKWMNINSKFILYSFKTVKRGKQMVIFLNCLLSIDIWALFATATHIQERRAKENNPSPYNDDDGITRNIFSEPASSWATLRTGWGWAASTSRTWASRITGHTGVTQKIHRGGQTQSLIFT